MVASLHQGRSSLAPGSGSDGVALGVCVCTVKQSGLKLTVLSEELQPQNSSLNM